MAAVVCRCLLALLPGVLSIDGQSHKASDEETERVWNDPNCERTRGEETYIDWAHARDEMHRIPFPESVPLIAKIVQRMEKPSNLDHESLVCPFGVISVFFFFVKFLIEGPNPQLDMARLYFSTLDSFTSGMHPHLLETADWLVRDSRIIALRRALLKRIRQQDEPKAPRVFVYDTEEVRLLSQGASFCGKGQWGMEVHIHEWLLTSGHLTKDPDEADFFFVPAYSICMFEAGFFPLPELDELYKRLVTALPFFSRNLGRDHIFTFGSGMSCNAFMSWRDVIPQSIQLSPETWLFNDFPHIDEPCFDPWRDIAIPGHLHRYEIISLASHSRPLGEREHLAIFLGRTDPSRGPHPATQEADVRGALRRLHNEGQIFVAQNLSFSEMHAAMGNSRFCFVPKGKSAWSLRFYEALFAGCVPVVLSDHWEFPFEDFLDVPSFVIKWPMAKVGDRLLELLQQIPDEVLDAYMQSGQRNRCWYVYPPLLAEIELDGSRDMLNRVCPDIQDENAYVGILKVLKKKQRVSRTAGHFLLPLGMTAEDAES